jgi:hypothetical protein
MNYNMINDNILRYKNWQSQIKSGNPDLMKI